MKLLHEIKPYLIWSFTPVIIILAGHALYQLLGGHFGPFIAITFAAMIISVLASLATRYRFLSRENSVRDVGHNIKIQNYALFQLELERYRKELELKYKDKDRELDLSLARNGKFDLPLDNFPRRIRRSPWPNKYEQTDWTSSTIDDLKVSIDGKEYIFTSRIGSKSSIFDVFTLPVKKYIDLLIDMHRIGTKDDSTQNRIK